MKIKKKHTNNNYLLCPIKRKVPIKRTPNYLKFRRYFKISLLNNHSTQKSQKTQLSRGILGLQATQSGYLLLEHIDILKKFLSPKTKNKYTGSILINLCIKLFSIRILTQKPLQSRIGRGKGLPTKWYCKVYKNEVILEFKELVNYYKCRALLQIVIKKLPLKTRLITNKELKIGKKNYTRLRARKTATQVIYIA